jgi:hypothetical protein
MLECEVSVAHSHLLFTLQSFLFILLWPARALTHSTVLLLQLYTFGLSVLLNVFVYSEIVFMIKFLKL